MRQPAKQVSAGSGKTKSVSPWNGASRLPPAVDGDLLDLSSTYLIRRTKIFYFSSQQASSSTTFHRSLGAKWTVEACSQYFRASRGHPVTSCRRLLAGSQTFVQSSHPIRANKRHPVQSSRALLAGSQS